MPKITKGSRVHIEFDAEVVGTRYIDGCFQDDDAPLENDKVGDIIVRDNTGHRHTIWMNDCHDAVKLLAPENFPPRIGDVWLVDGVQYFARRHNILDDVVVLQLFDNNLSGRDYYLGGSVSQDDTAEVLTQDLELVYRP